jgi:uncharacterized tellurite resistance protein B-like protein
LDKSLSLFTLQSMSILQLLKKGLATGTPSPETETIRKISESLDLLEPERARYVAAFAYLLCRVARADLKISALESRIMERIVVEIGGLPEEQAVLVVQIAKTQNRIFGGTENFLVAREFGAMASLEQKFALLHCLYSVAAADELISTVEDNEISQIADELRIEHGDFITVRSAYRDSLAVLKRPQEI